MSLITPELKKKFDELVTHYPDDQKQAATIPLLHLLQDKEGELTTQGQNAVADYLAIPVSKVHEVVTFYTMFSEKARGEKHLMVCRTLSCALMGSEAICATLKKKLGVGENIVTPNGKVSWETVECLAQCGTGPVIQIGDTVHNNMDVKKTSTLVEKIK